MGYKSVEFLVEGVSPLLMHNGRTTNPLDPMARLIKTVTDKNKRTKQDHELLCNLEFVAGLYTTEEIEEVRISGQQVSFKEAGKLCIPADNWETVFVDAAKKQRLGKQARAALLFLEPSILMGVPSPEDASNDKKYHFTKRVKIQKSAVMRTRPMFTEWACIVKFQFLPDILNESDVVQMADTAGSQIGVGDYRPKYGRFKVS